MGGNIQILNLLKTSEIDVQSARVFLICFFRLHYDISSKDAFLLPLADSAPLADSVELAIFLGELAISESICILKIKGIGNWIPESATCPLLITFSLLSGT